MRAAGNANVPFCAVESRKESERRNCRWSVFIVRGIINKDISSLLKIVKCSYGVLLALSARQAGGAVGAG
jgi:hypothetical protein